MELTHLDKNGSAVMVDVGGKDVTRREARALARVRMKPETLRTLLAGNLKKGDALATARIAGIMAAKRTFELIPLCHNIPLDTAVQLQDGRGDGGPYRRFRGGADRVRHVQGHRPGHDDRGDPSAGEIRRQERGIPV